MTIKIEHSLSSLSFLSHTFSDIFLTHYTFFLEALNIYQLVHDRPTVGA